MFFRIKRAVSLGLFALLLTICASAQADPAICANPGGDGNATVSGVINVYFQGNGNLAAGATTLTLGHRDSRSVASPLNVAPGDLLLVIQMQDGTFQASNDNTYGDGSGSGIGTLSIGDAGLNEFVAVTAVTGSNVTFSPALTNSYTQAAPTSTSGQKRYQVIRVPQYLAATAFGVTAPAWGIDSGASGETGGVVALDVQDTLTLAGATVEGQGNRAIFVAGKGFRGGAATSNSFTSPNTDWASLSSGAHGTKGEGIVGTPRYMAVKNNGYGSRTTNAVDGAGDLIHFDNTAEGYPSGANARGAPGNAGGGGTDGGGGNNNQENAGGGGGGNYAPGGLGGRPWNAPLTDTDGRGGGGYGSRLSFARVFLGGGGGSGGTNNGTFDAGTYENRGIGCALGAGLCSSGSAGGGIVIVRARMITGSGVIDARGANGYNIENDAGGGGGAGGSVVLNSLQGGAVTVDASGGDGGNAWAGHASSNPVGDRHGPGGGGGGGFVAFAPASLNMVATLDGGAPGRTTNGPDDTYSSSGFSGGLSTFQIPDTPGVAPGASCSTDLRLRKSDGTSTLTNAGTATYALSVTNFGNSMSSGAISVVDVLPPGLAVADGAVSLGGAQAAAWSCATASNVLTCMSSASIAASASSTFSFSASVTGANGTAAYNRARVGGGGDPLKPVPTATTTAACNGDDDAPGCAVDADTIQAPLLALSKSDGGDDVRAGGTTTYNLIVSNNGALATSGTIRVADVLPTGMSYTGTSPFTSGDFNCSYTTATLSFSCESTSPIAAAGSATIAIPVNVAGTAGSSLTSRARIGGGNDPGKSTLPDVAAAIACPAPIPPATIAADAFSGCASDTDSVKHVNLLLHKDDGQPFMAIGGTATYQFAVENTGDTASVGTIYFRDVLPTPMSWPTTLTLGGTDASDWACTRVSSTVVTCASSAVIAAGAQSHFSLVASVGAATSGTQYLNKARIGGGGDADLLAGAPASADVTACTGDNNPLGCALDLDTAQDAAQIRLVKSHATPQAASPGDTVAFTLAISNTGGIRSGSADTVRVIDVLPAGLTFTGTTPFTSDNFGCTVTGQVITCDNTNRINVGVTRSITFNALVSASATNALVNPAQVGTTGADPQNATLPTTTTVAACVANGAPYIGCAVDPIPLNADLSIAKSQRAGTTGAFQTGALTLANGQVVQFQLVAGNAGPSIVGNAGLADAIPAQFGSLSLVSATGADGATGCSTSAFTLTGHALAGSITSLPVGATCTLVVQATATTNGSSINTATIAAPDGIVDTASSNNSASVTTIIAALPTVQISKISLGDTGTFAFTGDNGYAADSITTTLAGSPTAGNTRTLTAVNTATTVTESAPPAGFSLSSISCSNLGAGGATIDLVNRKVTITAPAIVPGAAIECIFTNSKLPQLSINKSASPSPFVIGQPASYTITVQNTGAGATTAPITVADTLPTGITLDSASGTNWTCSGTTVLACTFSGTLAASASATLTLNVDVGATAANANNSATASGGGDGTCPAASRCVGSVAEPVVAGPQLSVTKSASPAPFIIGQPATYTIDVKNTGGSPSIGNISVADTLPTGITLASTSGTNWSCTGSSAVTCTFSGVIAVGGSAMVTLNVNVGAAAANGNNSATVSGGGDPSCPAAGHCSGSTTVTVVAAANLTVAKTASPTPFVVGQPASYTITVGNSGGSASVGAIAVTDTLPAGVSLASASGTNWSCTDTSAVTCTFSGVIAVGGSATVTLNVNVGTTAANGNNSATASGGGDPSCPAAGHCSGSTTVTVVTAPHLTVTKTASPSPFVVGQLAAYTITVTNSGGSATIAPITVADTLPTDLTLASASGSNWSCGGTTALTCTFSGTLAAGAGTTLTLNVDVGATAANGNNSATASGGGDPTCPSAAHCVGTVIVPVAASADVALAKSVDNASPNVGDTVVFTVTASNNGPNDATGVQVTDALPSGLVFVSATPSQGTYDSATGLWSIGALANGSSATLDVAATVLTPGPLTNTATRTAGDQFDPASSNNAGSASLNAQPSADLQVSKTASNATPNLGTAVTFTVTLTNAGPNEATGVLIDDLLPPGLVFVSAVPSQGTYDDDVGLWSVGALNAGDTVTLTVIATVTLPGDLTNTASIADVDQHDPNLTNNSAGVTINGQSADIQVIKTVDNANPVRGDTVTFTITASNNGPSAATGVAISDALPAGLSLVSANASQGTFAADTWTLGNLAATGAGATANLTIVADVDTDAGFTNTAILSALDQTDPNPANNSSSVPVNPTASADLDISKTDGVSTATPGQSISYTIVATNAGPSDVTGAQIQDTLPATLGSASWTCTGADGATCLVPSGNGDIATNVDLPAGASATFIVTGTVDASATGTLVNTATIAAATGVTDPPGNNSATDTDSLVAQADLDVVKTGPATLTPGSQVIYAITLHNAGSSNASAVSLDDPTPAGLTFVSADAPCASGFPCAIGDMSPAASVIVNVTYAVAANYAGTSVTNAATVGSATPDPDNANNSASVTTPIAAVANLAISKTDGSATYTPGGAISYVIVATNDGPSDVTDATVVDTLPASIGGATWTCVGSSGATCTPSGSGNVNATVNISVGATATFTVSGTVSASATGTLANTATIAAPTGITDPTPENNSATDTDTLAASADIEVVKTGPASTGFGGALSYSVMVANHGPSDANGSTFSDTVPAGITGVGASCSGSSGGASCDAPSVAGNTVSGTIATLPANATVTFTISGTAPTSGTSVTNTATGTPPGGTTDPTPTNNTGSATTTLLQPQLILSKTATPGAFTVGQPASYTLTVSNTGAGPSSGAITIDDTLPTGITLDTASGSNWTCSGTIMLSCAFSGTLAAGGSTTLTLNVLVGATAANGNNSATASGGGDPSCPAAAHCVGTVIVPVAASADIALAKIVDNASPNVGDTVVFTVTASNNGPNDATGVQVTDALPSGLAYLSATPSQGTYDSATGLWSIGALANGANATLAVSASVLRPGALTNTATRTAGDQFDPNASNNGASASLNALPSADLQVAKTVDNAVPNLGSDVVYTITVTNAGPNPATGVSVNDALPIGINFVSASTSQGNYNPATGVWTIGGIINGASVTLAITATVTLPGDITNTASIGTSDQHDPNLTNNSAGVTLNGQSADIQVIKTVNDANPLRGDTITYTVTATNNGPSAATGVILSDVLPAGLGLISATPSQGNFDSVAGVWDLGTLAASGPGATATLSIVASVDTDAGLTNTANVSGADQPDTNPANNSSSVVVAPVASADISVIKSGPPVAIAGQTVTYSLALHNGGPSDAASVSLADPTPAGLTFVSASAPCTGGFPCALDTLANGATTTITATFAVPANTPTASPIQNLASVSSTTGDPDNANNSSAVTTPVVAQANLAIVKSAPATLAANSAIHYDILVSNDGPSNADGAVFNDAVPAAISAVTASCSVASGGAVCSSVNVAGNSVSSAITTFPPGASVTFSIDGTTPPDTASLANTATIATPPTVTDPDSNDNSSTATTAVTAVADVSVVKTGPVSAIPGTAVVYTLAIGNAGPSTASVVQLDDPTPAGLLFVTATAPCAGGFPCALGDLASGASTTITVTYAVPANYIGASIVNSANVSSSTPDSDSGNDTGSVTTPIAGVADLSVLKTGPASVTAASAISYTVVVANAGPSDVANAQFTDAVPAPITGVSAVCASASGGAVCGAVNVVGNGVSSSVPLLPAGGSVTFTISGTAPSEAATLSNTAIIGAVGITDPNPANNTSTATTTVTASADVSIVKTGPATITSGGSITYTLLIANAGPSAADGASWSDAVPAGITAIAASCGSASGGASCTAPTVAGNTVSGTGATLPAGSSITITITGTAPFGTQTLANTATVTPPAGVPDPNTANNSSSVSTTIGGAADIALTKTVDNTAPNVGQSVTFTITAINNGPDDASGIAVTDNLPAGLGFVSATPAQGTYVGATGLWTIGNLLNGASTTLTIVATIDQPGSLTNTVAVSASDQPDPDTSNNNAGASVNAGASADIGIAKSVDNATPNVGSTITYTLVATNHGPNDATGIEVIDLLPTGTSFVSANPDAAYNSASGAWTVGALVNGAAETLTITVNVDQAGSITNSATISHEDQFDPVNANNAAGVTINGQEADLAVTKTVDNATPNVGSNVTFSVTVHNNGPSDATGMVLTDVLPAGLAFVSAIATQGNYDDATGLWTVDTLTASGPTSTATLSVVAQVTAAGAMSNIASVTGADQPDPNSANNSGSASLNGNPQADLALSKSGPATVTPGNTVIYTIVVNNNGPSDAANVSVADPTPAGLTFVNNVGACASAYPCTLGTLANGASATITSTYSVPADYAGMNPIVNIATASTDTPDPDTTNNTASVSTNIGAGNADLAIVKTGPAMLASGGAISYALTIVNNGPSPANGANYADNVPAAITAVSASCGGETGGAACTTQPGISGNLVSGTVGSLPSGGQVVVTVSGIASMGPVTLSNTATIEVPPGVVDPDPVDNTSTFETSVTASSANLNVQKSGPASVGVGTNATYTLSVANAGPDDALNVMLDDPTPAGLVFVSASIPCQSGFPCALGDVISGGNTIVMVTFAVPAGASGSVANTATTGSDTPDPDPLDNISTVATAIVPIAPPSADLAVSKSGPATAIAGTAITYTITLANRGPDVVPDAVLGDPTAAGLTFVSASAPCAGGFPCALGALANGASATVTATYTVNSAFAGSVTNIASANSASVPDPTPTNNSSIVATTVAGGPAVVTAPVPVDACWMLLLMLSLMLAGASLARRRA